MFSLKFFTPLFIILVIIFGLWVYNNINKDNNVELDNKLEKEISLENFSYPKRYMYQSSGIKRNSSWDIRGEDSLIKFEPEKTGIFNESSYENNYTNQK